MKVKLALTFNILIVICELLSFAFATDGFHGMSLTGLQYFTIDSNLFSMFTSLIFVIAIFREIRLKSLSKIPTWVHVLRYTATVCMALTFVVVFVILLPMDLQSGHGFGIILRMDQFFHHMLCPIFMMVSFIFFEGGSIFKPSIIAISMTPMMIYATVTMVLNIERVMVGPYPFLYVYQQPPMISVLWCVLIFVLTLILSIVLGLLQSKRMKKK